MPFNSAVVGQSTRQFTHDVDARWLMAYAAGLGDTNERYMDTAANRVIAHPVFPVCLEWPVILDCFNLPGTESVTQEEQARNVHAAHNLEIFRPIRAGETLTTTATVVALSQIKPGAAQTIRLDTRDENDGLVCRTYQLGIKRGLDIIGEPKVDEEMPTFPEFTGGEDWRIAIPIAKEAAHVYTECARIWNPVHTDRAVALGAGLPDIILHGTATMALAVSRVVDRYLDGEPSRVVGLGGRFSAMVLMPSTIELLVHADRNGVISYTVFTQDNQKAISQGFVCYE